MVQKLIREIKLHNERIFAMIGITVVFVLLGFCGTMISISQPSTQGVSVSSGAVVVAMFIYVLVSGVYYHQEAMLALSLSQTRRDFMLCFWLRDLLWLVGAYLFALLCYGMEWLFISFLAPRVEKIVALPLLFDWKFVVLGLPTMALVSMFLGLLNSRFEKLGNLMPFTVIILSYARQLFFSNAKLNAGTAAAFNSMAAVPSLIWKLLGVLALAAVAYMTIQMGRRQRVRQ